MANISSSERWFVKPDNERGKGFALYQVSGGLPIGYFPYIEEAHYVAHKLNAGKRLHDATMNLLHIDGWPNDKPSLLVEEARMAVMEYGRFGSGQHKG